MGKPKPRKSDYSLLLDLLDHGWIVDRFNSKEVTLQPANRMERK